ncbi:MAG: hypothetical protein UMV23_02225, partial [Halanaerobium sp.]|nr:hypothetical protein [Halanaerobium sp.]
QLHLTWKMNQKNLGGQFYNKANPADNSFLLAEPINLGRAEYSFTDNSAGMRQIFAEDIGARMQEGPEGNLYLTWTYAYWVKLFNKLHSNIFIVKISPEGRVLDDWMYAGRGDFALFADLALDENGAPLFVLEDYYYRSFKLYLSHYNLEREEFELPEILTSFYGNHRLVSAGNSQEGNLLVFWRQIAGKKDTVWFRNSKYKSTRQWYDRWGLWFLREAPVDSLREGFFVLLYSVVGGLIGVARNSLTLVFFFFLFYFLQKLRLLDKMNFFLMLALSLGAIIAFKQWLPVAYSTLVHSNGFLLFSFLISTIVVIFAGKKYWVRNFEGVNFLTYIIMWIYIDCLLSYLYMAPHVLGP